MVDADRETQTIMHLRAQVVKQVVGRLDDGAAACAEQVMMRMFTHEAVLIPNSQIDIEDQPKLNQARERSVDGGVDDEGRVRAEARQQGFGRQMIAPTQDNQDEHLLLRYARAPLPQRAGDALRRSLRRVCMDSVPIVIQAGCA